MLLIVSLLVFSTLHAQQRLIMRAERKPLLRELQLTQRQRIQIQELVRQQRAQELIYNMRLQQILTPAQREKLLQYTRQKELADSLDRAKKLP